MLKPHILRTLMLLLFVSTNVNYARAQEIGMEETLNYINQKFGQVCQVDALRGVMIAKYYDGQELVREDQVLCKSLDITAMQYDKVNRIFSINCNGSNKCVDRQLFVRKIQRDYNRISFPVTLDSKSESGMKKAFTHMINLVLDTKYTSSEPFE